eukprot:TRINITY_DN4164_c1_g1_i1.p1 TRINITY_DN4164_c1_g1~~TRINITY_DN4164_c1_g1_i1.p1  ORF type:complete len:173 (+),score=56.90 TRINITY_DN4164_c1_g1_i1:105-623(+)
MDAPAHADAAAAEGGGVEEQPNPFRRYAETVLSAVPSLVAVFFTDAYGHCRAHAVRDGHRSQWKLASTLPCYASALEKVLQNDGEKTGERSGKESRKRVTLWLDEYVVVQDTLQLPGAAGADCDDSPPTVVVTLAARAHDGEGDVAALQELQSRIRECPAFQALTEHVATSF